MHRHLIFVVSILILCCCSSEIGEPNANTISTKELLVDSNVYPDNWVKDEIRSHPQNVDVENIHVTFRYESNINIVSVHAIARYNSVEEAKIDYNKEIRIEYTDSIDESLALSIRSSPIADDFSTVCGKVFVNNMIMCVSTARYKNYVSTFSTYIWRDVMNISDYNRIIVSIDNSMKKLVL